MELKAGYKQTEVGVIPEDWQIDKFRNITKVITCGLAATPTYVPEQIGKPFLSAQNVRNGNVVYDKHKYISNQLFSQITKHNKPQKGDILYTRVGAGIGEAGVIEDDYEFGIYVSLTLIKVDDKKINSHFIAHLLNSDRYKFLAKNGQFAGGGVQNLNVEVVREFIIPILSLKEQTAIANALSDADALIQSLTRLIAKKRQIKQGAMQTLLNPYENGRLKEGWMLKKLGDICENITTGKLDANAMIENGEYSFFTCAKQVYRINHFAFDYEALLVSGNGANVGYIHYFKGKFNAYQRTYVLSRFKCDVHYLKVFMERNLQNRIKVEVNAGNTPYIVMGTLTGMDVLLPENKTEQTRIATILSGMDTEIAALEAKLAKYQQIKQGMMQNLLTGKIRLI